MEKPAEHPFRLIIEPMSADDVEAVAAIERASFSDPWPPESFYGELQNSLAYYFVARLDEAVTAYIGAWLVLEKVHITTLAVAEACRRQGIASRLVERLIAATRARGGRFLTLEVRPSNRTALKFYEKYGFTVLSRRRRYYINEDALIMTREDLQSYDK